VVDYGKLIDEERRQKDSAVSVTEAEKAREIEVLAWFKNVETDLGAETAKANHELKQRGDAEIAGPFRAKDRDDRIELAYGQRNPACWLTLESAPAAAKLSRIHVELFDDAGKSIGLRDYVIEGEATSLAAYKALVEGFPDHDSPVTTPEIAQEIVPAILRGRFA
jgi:hypothetical protein